MALRRRTTAYYRDNEGSRFYKANRLSPEATWQALGDELGRVLADAQRAFWRSRLEMNPERVRWHGAIFARHFPTMAGVSVESERSSGW
jgi:hypothetical protein